MKKKWLTLFYFLCFVFCNGFVFSQEDSPLSFGADVMSRYVWRGVNLGGNNPSIQPWLKYSVSSKDTSHVFAIGAWAAISTGGLKSQETDLVLSYTFKNVITIWFTDYFFPKDTLLARNHYFQTSKTIVD